MKKTILARLVIGAIKNIGNSEPWKLSQYHAMKLTQMADPYEHVGLAQSATDLGHALGRPLFSLPTLAGEVNKWQQ